MKKTVLSSLLLLAAARAGGLDGGIGLETTIDDPNEDYIAENAWLEHSDFEGYGVLFPLSVLRFGCSRPILSLRCVDAHVLWSRVLQFICRGRG